MAKAGAREVGNPHAASEVVEGQEVFDLPGVTPEGEQTMVPFVAPAASQWRRRLREDEILAYIKDQVSGGLAEDDPAAVMEMLGSIARATTFDEAISNEATTKGREILDTVLAVWGFKFLKSQHEKGCPFFVLADAKNTKTGETELVNLGGWKVVATCAWAHYAARDLPEGSPFLVQQGTPGAIEKHEYPFYFKIRKEKTSAGFDINLIVSPMA